MGDRIYLNRLLILKHPRLPWGIRSGYRFKTPCCKFIASLVFWFENQNCPTLPFASSSLSSSCHTQYRICALTNYGYTITFHYREGKRSDLNQQLNQSIIHYNLTINQVLYKVKFNNCMVPIFSDISCPQLKFKFQILLDLYLNFSGICSYINEELHRGCEVIIFQDNESDQELLLKFKRFVAMVCCGYWECLGFL